MKKLISFTTIFVLFGIIVTIGLFSCKEEAGVNGAKFAEPQYTQGGYPSDRKYTLTHEWIKIMPDSKALVGITQYGVGILGVTIDEDIQEPPLRKEDKDACGTITGTLTEKTVYAPVSGDVIGKNALLITDIGIVSSDPYGAGWLLRFDDNFDMSDYNSLMNSDEYTEYVEGL